MLAKIKVYDRSSDLGQDINDIKRESQSTGQAFILISKETGGKGSSAYLVNGAGTKGYFGGGIDPSKGVPDMAIIPTGNDTYYRDPGKCPTEVVDPFGHEQIHTFVDGTIKYNTAEFGILTDSAARDALLKKKMYAGSIHDLLDYLGMDKPSETGSLQRELGIDFVK